MPPVSPLFRGVYESLHGMADGLNSDVFASGGMAGEGSGARSWSAAYDPIASAALHAVCELTTGYGVIAAMLDHTWQLYATADCASFEPRPIFGAPPSSQLPPLELLHVASAPTAYGVGKRFDLPWPLSLVVDALAMVHWPTADVERLQRLAGAWRSAAGVLQDTVPAAVQAAAALEVYRAPGLARAIEVAARMQATLLATSHACEALAAACDAYATTSEGLCDALHGLVQGIEEVIGAGAFIAVVSGGIGVLVDGAGGGGVLAARIGAIVGEILSVDAQVAALGTATVAATAGLAATMKNVPDLSHVRLPTAEVYDGIGKMASDPAVEGFGGRDADLVRHAPEVGGDAGEGYAPMTQERLRDFEEATNTHVIGKHVRQPYEDMWERLSRSTTMRHVSTFRSEADAVTVINRVLDDTAAIKTWLAGPEDIAGFNVRVPSVIGKVLGRTGRLMASSNFRVIFVRDSEMPDGFRVLTAYPRK